VGKYKYYPQAGPPKGEVNMLLGQVNNKLDDKNRLSFPFKFRKEMGDKLIITQNMEGCLLVIALNKWKTLLAGTESKPFILKEVREVQRFLFGGAIEIELDDKGRFILPEHLKIYSGIGLEAVFIGVYNRVEIWDKKRWEEYNKNNLIKNISEISEKLRGE
jgi:MraZ protein